MSCKGLSLFFLYSAIVSFFELLRIEILKNEFLGFSVDRFFGVWAARWSAGGRTVIQWLVGGSDIPMVGFSDRGLGFP